MASPTRCSTSQSAGCYPKSFQAEKPARVPCTDGGVRGVVEVQPVDGADRVRIAHDERVVAAEEDLRGAEALDEESHRGGIEYELVVVEAPCRGRGRLLQQFLRLGQHLPRVHKARQQHGHGAAAVTEADAKARMP